MSDEAKCGCGPYCPECSLERPAPARDDSESAAYVAATDELDRWHLLFGANTTPEEAKATLKEAQEQLAEIMDRVQLVPDAEAAITAGLEARAEEAEAALKRHVNEGIEAHHDEVARLLADLATLTAERNAYRTDAQAFLAERNEARADRASYRAGLVANVGQARTREDEALDALAASEAEATRLTARCSQLMGMRDGAMESLDESLAREQSLIDLCTETEADRSAAQAEATRLRENLADGRKDLGLGNHIGSALKLIDAALIGLAALASTPPAEPTDRDILSWGDGGVGGDEVLPPKPVVSLSEVPEWTGDVGEQAPIFREGWQRAEAEATRLREALEKAEAELSCLRAEIQTVVGPVKPHHGMTLTACIVARVGEVATELDEARRDLAAAQAEATRLREAARAVIATHRHFGTDEQGRRTSRFVDMTPELTALGDVLYGVALATTPTPTPKKETP